MFRIDRIIGVALACVIIALGGGLALYFANEANGTLAAANILIAGAGLNLAILFIKQD